MTTLSGIITLAAASLFTHINFGAWWALVIAAVGAVLVFMLHKSLKRDPEEDTD